MNMDQMKRPLLSEDIEELRQRLQFVKQRSHITPPHELRHYERALEEYRARRARAASFRQIADLLGEPAWDMMLDLYAATAVGQRVTVTAATNAACVPATTGIRLIRTLEGRGVLERAYDPTDKRRCHLMLSAAALGMMNDWFERSARAL